jgi:prophage regulatory protein
MSQLVQWRLFQLQGVVIMIQSQILRINQVIEISGLSRSSIYRLVHIGLFPKPIKIGISAVGWVAAEIDQWIADRKSLSMVVRSAGVSA